MNGPNVFAVARSIWDDEDFEPEPFSQREAFIWLVSAAAWRDCKIRGNHKQPIHIQRGEFSFSVRFLADKWDWTKSRVHRFLARLVKLGILRDTSRDGAQLFLLNNYNRFQVVGLPKRDSAADTSGTAAGQQRDKEETGKQLNINTPPTPPEGGGDEDEHLLAWFERFWEAYPRRIGSNPKRPASQKFRTAVTRYGADPARIVSGAKALAAEFAGRPEQDRRFIPTSQAWLNQRRWEDHTPTETNQLRRWKGPEHDIDLRKPEDVLRGGTAVHQEGQGERNGHADVDQSDENARAMGDVVSLFSEPIRRTANGLERGGGWSGG